MTTIIQLINEFERGFEKAGSVGSVRFIKQTGNIYIYRMTLIVKGTLIGTMDIASIRFDVELPDPDSFINTLMKTAFEIWDQYCEKEDRVNPFKK